MSYTPHHSDVDLNAALPEQGEHEIDGRSATVRPGHSPRQDGTGVLQQLAAAMQCGASPLQVMESIAAGNRQPGNRAFMHWVGALHAAGRGGGAHTDTVPGWQDPGRSAPLQFMPTKRRKKEPAVEVTPEGQTQATPETGTPEVPGTTSDTPSGAVAQAGAEAAATRTHAAATKTAVAGEKKKKKKSRVQVALNTLRAEGVEAFKDYLEAEVDDTALLDTLIERVHRAQDLAGVRDAALDVVQARLRTLDPMAVANLPQASAQGPEQVVEGAVIAPVKTSPTYREVALLDSCIRGDARKLESLLRFGTVDINMMTPNGTLLYIAAIKNHQTVVKVLLSRPGIDVNQVSSSGFTPLYAAAQRGHLEAARMLLERPEINPSICTSNRGTPPLTIAASSGHKEMVELLLSFSNTNINLREKEGGTALLFAADINCPKIVELLIRGGADVNLSLRDGTTPLCLAAFKGYIEVVKLLLQVPGVQINKPGTDKATPLYAACYQEHKEIVRLLLNNGADPNIAAQGGWVALRIACAAGNTKIVRLLLNNGADPNIAAQGGRVALQVACGVGITEIVELLLNNKADPNMVDDDGFAPLHIACLLGSRESVEMLLDAGADMGLMAEDEYTPYRVASIADQQEVMSLLEARSRHRAGQAAQLESLPPACYMQGQALEVQAEQATPTTISTALLPAEPTKDSVPTPETVQGGGVGAGAETDGKAQAVSKSGGSSQTAPGSQAGVTETRSLLEQSKLEFRQDILKRLKDELIDHLDGIRLLEAVNMVADLDGLCGIYNRLAGIERKKMRARNRPLRRRFAEIRDEAKPKEISGFILGDNANLDAEAVEAEIRKYLAPAHHKFISQAVNNMEFGRGKPTTGYPGLLHASAGIAGVGSCSIFYYPDADRNRMRIVGLGYHAGRSTYRLGYSVDELSECGRVLRIA